MDHNQAPGAHKYLGFLASNDRLVEKLMNGLRTSPPELSTAFSGSARRDGANRETQNPRNGPEVPEIAMQNSSKMS